MEVQDALAGWSNLDDGTRDALIILLALVAVTALAVGWALFVRRKKRHRHHRHHHPHNASESAENEAGEDEEIPATSHHRRRKWRRRRRDHRPRNPTLAETGGLPPVREGPPNTGP